MGLSLHFCDYCKDFSDFLFSCTICLLPEKYQLTIYDKTPSNTCKNCTWLYLYDKENYHLEKDRHFFHTSIMRQQ